MGELNMHKIIGTCGSCGGRVAVPELWSEVVPPYQSVWLAAERRKWAL